VTCPARWPAHGLKLASVGGTLYKVCTGSAVPSCPASKSAPLNQAPPRSVASNPSSPVHGTVVNGTPPCGPVTLGVTSRVPPPSRYAYATSRTATKFPVVHSLTSVASVRLAPPSRAVREVVWTSIPPGINPNKRVATSDERVTWTVSPTANDSPTTLNGLGRSAAPRRSPHSKLPLGPPARVLPALAVSCGNPRVWSTV
jgi:hypothetical protein